MILTLNLRANIILSHQFDVEWTLNIELCLLGYSRRNYQDSSLKSRDIQFYVN